jgi:hypothetical protein
MVQDQLRGFVEAVARDVEGVSRGASGEDPGRVGRLTVSWAKLVDFLALGPAPELAACPYCGVVGMRAATRCGHCWRKLVPPAPGGRTPGFAAPPSA